VGFKLDWLDPRYLQLSTTIVVGMNKLAYLGQTTVRTESMQYTTLALTFSFYSLKVPSNFLTTMTKVGFRICLHGYRFLCLALLTMQGYGDKLSYICSLVSHVIWD
jgi:hypothetical protein